MPVRFEDNSIKVKAEINQKTVAWLTAWANEIASTAKDNTKLDGPEGAQLRGSYRADVNAGNGEAKIGTPLESGYWEEYGTGEHAAHGDGRKGWWIYKDGYDGKGGKQLTESQAKAIAAGEPDVHATNGRDPSYTLEKAFIKNKPKAIADLERKMKEL